MFRQFFLGGWSNSIVFQNSVDGCSYVEQIAMWQLYLYLHKSPWNLKIIHLKTKQEQQESKEPTILIKEMHMHASVSLFVLCKRDLTWLLVWCVLFIIVLCERNTGLTIWSAFTQLYNTSATACLRPFFLPMVRVGLLFDLRHCDTQPRGISHGCGLSERLVKKTHHWSGESLTENPSIPVRISQINKFKLYRSTPGVWKAGELRWRTQFWWEQLIETQSLVWESKVILRFGLCLGVWVSWGGDLSIPGKLRCGVVLMFQICRGDV